MARFEIVARRTSTRIRFDEGALELHPDRAIEIDDAAPGEPHAAGPGEGGPPDVAMARPAELYEADVGELAKRARGKRLHIRLHGTDELDVRDVAPVAKALGAHGKELKLELD